MFLDPPDGRRDRHTYLHLRGQDFPDQKIPLLRGSNGSFMMPSKEDDAALDSPILWALPREPASREQIIGMIRASNDPSIRDLSESSIDRQLKRLAETEFVERIAHGLYRRKVQPVSLTHFEE